MAVLHPHHHGDPAVRKAGVDGALDILPVLIGVIPFAVVIGMTIAEASVDKLAAWSSSVLLCAGTAQLAALQLLDGGATPLAVVGTVALINSRYALYSTSLARWFSTETLARRLTLAFPLVDQLFVLCASRFEGSHSTPRERVAYYSAAAVVLMAGWVATQSLALLFATSVPDLGVLELAGPLVFCGLLARAVVDRAELAAAVAAAAGTVLAQDAPHSLAIVAGISAGVLVGSATDRCLS